MCSASLCVLLLRFMFVCLSSSLQHVLGITAQPASIALVLAVMLMDVLPAITFLRVANAVVCSFIHDPVSVDDVAIRLVLVFRFLCRCHCDKSPIHFSSFLSCNSFSFMLDLFV